ncbi:endonuclease/exonuclease/phosphatase family protein [Halochromatium glycolicum]|uniref:Endonuclease/exonuclease/phosphatase domain-containing protein n=1 Tax=Halochromatium glycolicum TaxID=85075 RepID=A0AAJ0XAF1_9GAMM|nr:endonuclease/exonuclease/phosphatase family protein [Halochromatium glycolicum]MBK1705273.1 hypothetical protein [Halochromatium glycolicum]
MALGPRSSPIQRSMQAPIIVATYNIHRAVGGDRRQDPLRIAETIAALDADIVALQEVETPARPEPLILLQRLLEHGYEALLGHTMRRGPHHYGNVLLSRLPITGHRLIDLSQPGREPRGLIDARLRLGPDSTAPVLRCLATHLGLRPWERRRQIAQVSAALDARAPASAAAELARTVLLGDFNEWRRGHSRLAPLTRLLSPVPNRASFPSILPLLALDRIWHGSGLSLEHLEAVRTASTRAASDHLPVRARLRLRLTG